MLSFWASWCSDCRAQLSSVNEINRRYHKAGLRSVAVSMDGNRHSPSEDLAPLALNFPVLDDTDLSVSRLYDVESLPIAILIDREGVVRNVIQGYGGDSEQRYQEVVQALLTE